MLGIKTLRRAYKEYKEWRVLYNVTKEDHIEKEFKQAGFKISWIGFPYKLYPIPNEFLETNDTVQNYIFMKLKEVNETLLEPFRLSDVCYPKLVDVEVGVYMIVLESKLDYLKVKKLVPILIGYSILGFVLYRLQVKYDIFSYISEYAMMGFEFIKNLFY